MTALVWDKSDARPYEAGVSLGVFYPLGGLGVPWNGLRSVQEGIVGGDVVSRHLDGIKYLDFVGNKNYQAIVSAFSAPKEFYPYSGKKAFISGFLLSSQPKLRFNFSYRTEMDVGYKIHLVYNILATPTVNGYSTLGKDVTPSTLEWKFDAVPVLVSGFKPAAHFVVDSTRAPSGNLVNLENKLYGTNVASPAFPSISELTTLFPRVL